MLRHSGDRINYAQYCSASSYIDREVQRVEKYIEMKMHLRKSTLWNENCPRLGFAVL
jgi:hypothetical protein